MNVTALQTMNLTQLESVVLVGMHIAVIITTEGQLFRLCRNSLTEC